MLSVFQIITKILHERQNSVSNCIAVERRLLSKPELPPMPELPAKNS